MSSNPPIINTEYYQTLSNVEKLDFFDSCWNDELNKLSSQQLVVFLKTIILAVSENSYIRIRALQCLIYYVLQEKVKKRSIITLLLDDWLDSSDIHLEMMRCKLLLSFYTDATEDIESFYKHQLKGDELELFSESALSLGLIYFFKANSAIKINDFNDAISKSIDYLKISYESIENRIDSQFFYEVAFLMKNASSQDLFNIDHTIDLIANLMFEHDLFSNGSENYLQEKIHNALVAIRKIEITKPQEWLNFQKEFNNLCNLFYCIKDNDLSNLLFPTELYNSFSKRSIVSIVKPFFQLNFAAESARIDKLLSMLVPGSKEYKFLDYLRKIISSRLSIVQKDEVRKHLIGLYPTKHIVIDKLLEASDSFTPERIMFIHDKLKEESYENLLHDILYACQEMQSQYIHKTSDEDAKNTCIAGLLEAKGYNVKDQTKRGKSSSGISSGELDIFVQRNDKTPFAVIEPYVLSSLDKLVIDKHTKKIFGYDTSGNKYNFILVYSQTQNFQNLWDKYISYIPEIEFEYKAKSFIVEDTLSRYTDIRIGKSTHIRNIDTVFLYHIFINNK